MAVHSIERVIRTGCPAHNCGGRCLLKAYVRDGVITRLDTDDRPVDSVSQPQLRACARGRAYLRRQYHPDRLRHPLKRVGQRGEGQFEPISWDEALDTVARELIRVKDTYGNGALFVPYGTGGYSQLTGSQTARRLLNLFGGCLGIYNSYSWGATNIATPYVYGTLRTGNQRQDWLNSQYILMWSWNPAEARDGTNSDFMIKKARENGARVVCIDPRMTMSSVSLADEWIPIRPGTDVAMMSAMAYVIITEELYDEDFVRRCCVGFDSSTMPAGADDAESYADYILGVRDGIPKTPAWAEAITAVPAATIARIAREYATTRPGVLYQGYGMQRRAYGEQVVRAGAVLAAITGNVGIPGGWASALASPPGPGPFWFLFPMGENPYGREIPCFLWSEAVLRGKGMGPELGVLGHDRLDSDIKLIYAVASNALINQHANINRSAAILRDESKVEFLVVQDNFLTSTARFADIVLPACTQFETWGLADGWKFGEELLLMPQVVEPLAETRSDYRICADLAERLGIGAAYTEGRDERGWVEWLIHEYRRRWLPDLPSLDELVASNQGVHSVPVTEPKIAFADFRTNPEAFPLDTPSGKVEIFSQRLHEMGRPDDIPAVPKYIEEWESPFGLDAARYPLQALGSKTLHRVHSTHDNVDWLEEAFPQVVLINPVDAGERDIADGDQVRVCNDRGEMVIPCRVTARIMPGVVDVPSGGWWTPDENGVDRRGSVNVLTSERWTPLVFGSAQHTIMVQVEAVR
ncbi:MAG: DMSO/selenate family reductase complex A subunit [Planctomycetota bacterium]|jgi:anaerobic dimethyl sulfoxide reductase subunit A